MVLCPRVAEFPGDSTLVIDRLNHRQDGDEGGCTEEWSAVIFNRCCPLWSGCVAGLFEDT
jgi:hypothetical protein